MFPDRHIDQYSKRQPLNLLCFREFQNSRRLEWLTQIVSVCSFFLVAVLTAFHPHSIMAAPIAVDLEFSGAVVSANPRQVFGGQVDPGDVARGNLKYTVIDATPTSVENVFLESFSISIGNQTWRGLPEFTPSTAIVHDNAPLSGGDTFKIIAVGDPNQFPFSIRNSILFDTISFSIEDFSGELLSSMRMPTTKEHFNLHRDVVMQATLTSLQLGPPIAARVIRLNVDNFQVSFDNPKIFSNRGVSPCINAIGGNDCIIGPNDIQVDELSVGTGDLDALGSVKITDGSVLTVDSSILIGITKDGTIDVTNGKLERIPT